MTGIIHPVVLMKDDMGSKSILCRRAMGEWWVGTRKVWNCLLLTLVDAKEGSKEKEQHGISLQDPIQHCFVKVAKQVDD